MICTSFTPPATDQSHFHPEFAPLLFRLYALYLR